MDTIKLLKTLSDAFGVSGFEDPVRETIHEIIEPYADEIRTDKLGNLMATKRGTSDFKLMLDAHMDEVGFMINHIDQNGFLGFTNLGGWDVRILPAHSVSIMNEGGKILKGIIGSIPPHIQKDEEKDKVMKMEDLFVDIGATSKQEAQDMGIKIGSFATIHYPFKQLNETYVVGKAFDDRAGCAVLIKTLENLQSADFDPTLVLNFAVCEETGLRGAKTAAFQIEPDLAIALEGTIGADVPGVSEKRQPVKMGKGPAFTVADKSIVVKQKVVKMLEKVATKNDIPFQYKRPAYGGTDAGSIHLSRGGVLAGIVSVPCRYIHSPLSTMRLDDFEHTVNLITELINCLPNAL